MKVSKQDYLDFIDNYKGELEIRQTEVMNPPMRSHIDPVSKKAIATMVMEWTDDNGNITKDDSLYEYYIKDRL